MLNEWNEDKATKNSLGKSRIFIGFELCAYSIQKSHNWTNRYEQEREGKQISTNLFPLWRKKKKNERTHSTATYFVAIFNFLPYFNNLYQLSTF